MAALYEYFAVAAEELEDVVGGAAAGGSWLTPLGAGAALTGAGSAGAAAAGAGAGSAACGLDGIVAGSARVGARTTGSLALVGTCEIA